MLQHMGRAVHVVHGPVVAEALRGGLVWCLQWKVPFMSAGLDGHISDVRCRSAQCGTESVNATSLCGALTMHCRWASTGRLGWKSMWGRLAGRRPKAVAWAQCRAWAQHDRCGGPRAQCLQLAVSMHVRCTMWRSQLLRPLA